MSELVGFWLQAFRGCLLRESVPIPVPYNQSDFDSLARRPNLRTFRHLTGKSVGPRLIVEARDEQDFDPDAVDKRLKAIST